MHDFKSVLSQMYIQFMNDVSYALAELLNFHC